MIPASCLQEFLQILHVDLAVAQDLVQQARSNRLAGMGWHYRSSAVFVAKKVMAAPDANNQKAAFPQGRD